MKSEKDVIRKKKNAYLITNKIIVFIIYTFFFKKIFLQLYSNFSFCVLYLCSGIILFNF